MFLDDVDYLVEDVVIHTIRSMCSSAYHILIAFHRFRCTICMFTYALASYRIVGGAASSSAGKSKLGPISRSPRHRRCPRKKSKARSYQSV
jgi:hypothetical protein